MPTVSLQPVAGSGSNAITSLPNNEGVWIGIAIGGFAFLLVLGYLVYSFYCKSKGNGKSRRTSESTIEISIHSEILRAAQN